MFGARTTGRWTDSVPAVGASHLVGPDEKLFVLSSNWAIHDYPLCIRLICQLYNDGLANAIDPELLVDRLEALTRQRRELVDEVVDDAKAGKLKAHRRWLP
jgi:hypothetical protein